MAPSSKVTKTIVGTVAEYENASPDELPPLASKLDVTTFQQLTATDSQISEPLSFEYLWYDVTVLPNREVIVTP